MVGNPDFFPGIAQDQAPDLEDGLEAPEGELHLRFFVASGMEFALPAIGIKEVLEYPPDRINPMPNVSPLLLGTVNIRGRVVWVGDLGQFLSEQTPVNTDRAEISIIAIEDQGMMLGLAVERIGVMAWLDAENLQLSRSSPDAMSPFIKGEWTLADGSSLKLLDQINILRSARWAS
ncbi:MAG: chemotaxis protein CheW [Pseudanabaenaceae cyanobacterium]|jgi:purine-binding chemotaxis protein CheW